VFRKRKNDYNAFKKRGREGKKKRQQKRLLLKRGRKILMPSD